jgi:excisionase family DNA binding protein
MDNKDFEVLADLIATKVSGNNLQTKTILNADEAAQFLSISRSYLYKLTMQRLVPFSRPLGKQMYFNREELERWAMGARVATDAELSAKANAYLGRKGGAL